MCSRVVDVQKKKLVRRILKRLRKRKVKAYVERSKSKGFHIWIFFDKPLRAVKARQFAKLVLHGLDVSKIEVFPKQDEVREGGLGNCIWLPLFGRDVSEDRTVFLDKHFALLDKQWPFLQSIRRTPRKIILRACRAVVPESAQLRDLSKLIAGRITEGTRNNTLTRIAGALRNQGVTESTILVALREENQRRCEPPLTDKEVESIAVSVSKYPPGKHVDSGKNQTSKLVATLAGKRKAVPHRREGSLHVPKHR